MKQKVYRHGEIMLCKISKLPTGLTASKEKVFMVGSHGHNHSINNGVIYFKKEGDFIFGYLKAKDTSLLHPEHSPKIGDAKIPNGYYKLIKQSEFTPHGLVPIID